MTIFKRITDLSLSGEILSHDLCRQVLNCPDSEILYLLAAAYAVRRYYFKNRVHIQLLTNAKSGLCQEDCHYCSQSRISTAEIQKYPLISKEKLLAEASKAKGFKAKRYCMALSGREPSGSEINALCGASSHCHCTLPIRFLWPAI